MKQVVDRRGELGQFLTPSDVALFLASLVTPPEGSARVLDPGAGTGSLGAAVVDHLTRAGTRDVSLVAVEVDAGLLDPLNATLDDCASSAGTHTLLVNESFIDWGVDLCTGFGSIGLEAFDLIVMNPPYKKIGTGSHERRQLARVGVSVTNLYAAFVSLAIRLLKPGGQLVAITPRSFANGPYFRSFRIDLLEHVALRRFHVFQARDVAFADTKVLQENVIFHAVRGGDHGAVAISTGGVSGDGSMVVREVPYDRAVMPSDVDRFIHLGGDQGSADIAERMLGLPGHLLATGCAVSTGRVVDFRVREHLRATGGAGTVPLIYPAHFDAGIVRWPATRGRKANALMLNGETQDRCLPNGHYVLVRRFSSKEERRRVVAVVSDPHAVPGDLVAFENHLNVFHCRNNGMASDLARGLALYLNSTVVDRYFRQFNGHTQVNAADLRKLPYPTRQQLFALGAAAGNAVLNQPKIDALLAEYVTELAEPEGDRHGSASARS